VSRHPFLPRVGGEILWRRRSSDRGSNIVPSFPSASLGRPDRRPNSAPTQTLTGTVALRANDAEPASIGAMAERQSRGAHVVMMHLNTRFSARVMLRVGWRGSMQQCPSTARLRNRNSPSCSRPCLEAGVVAVRAEFPTTAAPQTARRRATASSILLVEPVTATTRLARSDAAVTMPPAIPAERRADSRAG